MVLRIDAFSPRLQRLVALGLLTTVVLLLGAAIVVPYLSVVARYDNSLGRMTEKLAAYRIIAQQGGAIRAQQQALLRAERSRGYYLTGNKPALAAAELQRRVKQVIEQHAGTVVSSQVMGEKNEQGMRQIAVRVTLRMGIEPFAKVLHTLESQAPLLLFENVYLAARPGGARWRGGNTIQELDIRLDVVGFLHNPEAS